jgi:hypothetical protein
MSEEGRSLFWKVILSTKFYMYYMCPIPNGFRGRVCSLYISKIVDKKEILHTVSNTSLYCSSDKVGTVYQYTTFSKITPSTSVHFATSCEDMACYSSVQWNSAISETVQNRTHVHIHFFFLRMADTVTSQNTELSSWDTLYSILQYPSWEKLHLLLSAYALVQWLYFKIHTGV